MFIEYAGCTFRCLHHQMVQVSPQDHGEEAIQSQSWSPCRNPRHTSTEKNSEGGSWMLLPTCSILMWCRFVQEGSHRRWNLGIHCIAGRRGVLFGITVGLMLLRLKLAPPRGSWRNWILYWWGIPHQGTNEWPCFYYLIVCNQCEQCLHLELCLRQRRKRRA